MESLSKAKLLIVAIAMTGCLPMLAQAGDFGLVAREDSAATKMLEMELERVSEPLRWTLKPNLTPVDCYTYVVGSSVDVSSMHVIVEVENNGDWDTSLFEIYLHASSTDPLVAVDMTVSQLVYGLDKGEARTYLAGVIPVQNPGPGQSYNIDMVVSVDGAPGDSGRINEGDENDNSLLCSETYYGY